MKRFDFATGTYLEEPSDDIFTVVLEPPQTARITCRVCNRPATVAIDAPARLCALCGADVPATVAHVQTTYAAALARVDDAWARFDADMAQADEGTATRWAAYMDAGDAPQVLETRRKVRAGLVVGPLAVLIAAHSAWLDAHAQLVECGSWRNEALAELEVVS